MKNAFRIPHKAILQANSSACPRFRKCKIYRWRNSKSFCTVTLISWPYTPTQRLSLLWRPTSMIGNHLHNDGPTSCLSCIPGDSVPT